MALLLAMWLMAVHVGVGVAADCATSPGACLAKGASLLQMRSLNMRSARQIKQAPYVQGPTNTNVCPTLSSPIQTKGECVQATDRWNLHFQTWKTDANYPKGCYFKGHGVFWNYHATGSPESTSKPICTQQATWCLNGTAKTVANGTLYCCAGSCGTCGDSGCSERPGGGNNCCGDKLNRTCESADDTVCKVPPTQATYEYFHDGTCGSGWMGDNTHKATIGECEAQCRSRSGCGFFAYAAGVTVGNNCAVYTAADGCRDNNHYPQYDAYELLEA